MRFFSNDQSTGRDLSKTVSVGDGLLTHIQETLEVSEFDSLTILQAYIERYSTDNQLGSVAVESWPIIPIMFRLYGFL